MKISFFTLFAAVVVGTTQGFDIKTPSDGRRGFLTKSVEAVAGMAFIATTASKANAVENLGPCQPENGNFDVANSIASCHGESKDLTPSQEATSGSLMGKMGIDSKKVVDQAKDRVRFEDLEEN